MFRFCGVSNRLARTDGGAARRTDCRAVICALPMFWRPYEQGVELTWQRGLTVHRRTPLAFRALPAVESERAVGGEITATEQQVVTIPNRGFGRGRFGRWRFGRVRPITMPARRRGPIVIPARRP
jgi:hypothetical protein